MKKILFSAFACHPERGSEDLVGWNWVNQAAKRYEVEVVTRVENKEAIEALHTKNIKFHYCSSKNKHQSLSIYYEYYLWQKESYKLIKELCSNEKYDYLWQITFGNVVLPTFLYKLDVPLIWGPSSGIDKINKVFYRRFKFKEKFPLQMIRNIIINTLKFNPVFNGMVKKSKKIIVRTPDTYNYIPKKYRNKTTIHWESALNPLDVYDMLDDKEYLDNNKFNFVYTGQLIARKNIIFMLMAFSKVCKEKDDIHLNIVGTGKMFDEILYKIEELKIKDKVTLWGRCSRKKTLSIVSQSDCCLFPSLIDALASSLLETMALKKPIICLNVSGMQYSMHDSFAIRVNVENYDQCVKEYSEAIRKITNMNTEDRIEMGENAYSYLIKNYNWDEIGRFIQSIIE